MTGEQIKACLRDQLRKAQIDPSMLKKIHITNSTGDVEDLWGLIGDRPFDISCDTNEWNNKPGLMTDIIGGMVPDIVVRSKASSQNRIIIECKGTDKLNYGIVDSQVVRYFLWLLAMTAKDENHRDIRRAVLLAAPSPWFAKETTARSWNYFVKHYRLLASEECGFDMTLGEIRCDATPASTESAPATDNGQRTTDH